MRPLAWPLAASLALAAPHAIAQQAIEPQRSESAADAAAVGRSASSPLAPVPSAAAPKPEPLAADELSGLTGRQGFTSTILSDQDLTAINNGNSVTAQSVSSGQIMIGPGAFQGFAGVGNFVINSGHNNNLQGAITINVVSPQ